jgi:hypothetical protein
VLRPVVAAVVALAIAALPTLAFADRVVAIAPLSTLGSDAAGAPRKLGSDLEGAFGALPGTKVIGVGAVGDSIKKAKKPQLRACDGDPGCLQELGALVGADLVVFGEVGGLGDAQIVYLKLIDAKAGREVRNTTLEIGAPIGGGARGAAIRLLEPNRYVGRLVLDVDTQGASIFVNGKLVGKSPLAPLPVAVGTHAVRVTHPEFRDFVRFVDVEFDRPANVKVGLQQYPIVQSSITGVLPDGTIIKEVDPPWYRKWYGVAALGAGALAIGILVGRAFLACDPAVCDVEYERPID